MELNNNVGLALVAVNNGEVVFNGTFGYIPVQAYNDIITVSLVASNTYGYGPTIERNILVGYDIPEAPKNIVLTKDKLETTLTWDAPEIGVNGEEFDVENLNYTIVRFPDEVEVASGLTERIFVENHGSEMTRYVYEISYLCSFFYPLILTTCSRGIS